MPKGESASMDTVKEAQRVLGDHRAHEVLWQAQQYWLAMEQFRTDRERNKISSNFNFLSESSFKISLAASPNVNTPGICSE